MKGIFSPYVLWPFDKKLIFWIVTRVSARDYTVFVNVAASKTQWRERSTVSETLQKKTVSVAHVYSMYSHLSNKRGAHAYQFWKIPPSSKKISPPRLLISLLKCLILLQNLMTIFLTIILSYKTLFYHKNWCLLPPPHLVIFHFWHPSTFIPGSTFIREMRVLLVSAGTTWKGAKVQSKARLRKKKEGILDIDPEYKIVIWKHL